TPHAYRLSLHDALPISDLDNFKPFNDVFGYKKGDDVIQLTGKVLSEHVDPECDFLGHIGGDDFIILFQSADWEARCEGILNAFRSEEHTSELQSRENLV